MGKTLRAALAAPRSDYSSKARNGTGLEASDSVASGAIGSRLGNLWRNRKPELFAGLFCVLVLTLLAQTLVKRKLTIETENATLQGYAIPLSAEVAGEVRQVLVEEHQTVRRGQLLAVLDDRVWKARLDRAEGERGALLARGEAAKRDLTRSEIVLLRRAISPEVYDRALAESVALKDQIQAAGARVADARANYRRTRIVAPADGIIAFRTAQPGFEAQPGMPLFGFVEGASRWVLARVRETDLPDLHVGKPVDISFDGVPGRSFRGKIESLSPATETSFSMGVPKDFAAGNFTKYVQWCPIRIRLALNDADRARIPVGISSSVHMARD